MHRLVGGLSFDELKRGVQDLADMPLADKMWWLRFSLVDPSWETVDYAEVQAMVLDQVAIPTTAKPPPRRNSSAVLHIGQVCA